MRRVLSSRRVSRRRDELRVEGIEAVGVGTCSMSQPLALALRPCALRLAASTDAEVSTTTTNGGCTRDSMGLRCWTTCMQSVLEEESPRLVSQVVLSASKAARFRFCEASSGVTPCRAVSCRVVSRGSLSFLLMTPFCSFPLPAIHRSTPRNGAIEKSKTRKKKKSGRGLGLSHHGGRSPTFNDHYPMFLSNALAVRTPVRLPRTPSHLSNHDVRAPVHLITYRTYLSVVASLGRSHPCRDERATWDMMGHPSSTPRRLSHMPPILPPRLGPS